MGGILSYMVRLLVVLLVMVCARPVLAHLYVTDPVARHGMRQIKDGPCGILDSARSDNVNYFRPGETITITFDEYIGHPGHYRIAFDDDGFDFEDPICLENCDDGRSGTPVFAEDHTGMVLVDLIPDRPGTETYTIDVTLPDIECDNCTLQVIQVMYDKFPYTIGGNDNYYNCIDLVLTREDLPDAGRPDTGPRLDAGPDVDSGPGTDAAGRDASGGTDAGAGGGGGGCSASAAGNAAGTLWLVLSLVALRRREES